MVALYWMYNGGGGKFKFPIGLLFYEKPVPALSKATIQYLTNIVGILSSLRDALLFKVCLVYLAHVIICRYELLLVQMT